VNAATGATRLRRFAPHESAVHETEESGRIRQANPEEKNFSPNRVALHWPAGLGGGKVLNTNVVRSAEMPLLQNSGGQQNVTGRFEASTASAWRSQSFKRAPCCSFCRAVSPLQSCWRRVSKGRTRRRHQATPAVITATPQSPGLTASMQGKKTREESIHDVSRGNGRGKNEGEVSPGERGEISLENPARKGMPRTIQGSIKGH